MDSTDAKCRDNTFTLLLPSCSALDHDKLSLDKMVSEDFQSSEKEMKPQEIRSEQDTLSVRQHNERAMGK